MNKSPTRRRNRPVMLAFVILGAAALALVWYACQPPAPPSEAQIARLIDILREGDPFLDPSFQRRAGRASAQLVRAGQPAREMLSAAIDAEQDEWARARLCGALACMRWGLSPYYIHTLHPDYIGALCPRKDPPKGEWFSSLETFRKAGDASKLIRSFALGDTEASHYIFDALEALAPGSLEPLLDALHDEHPYFHFCVTIALMRVAPKSLPRLRQLAADENLDTRRRAVWTLGLSGLTSAVPDLVSALEDSDPGTRWSAAYMLAMIPDRSAVGALLQALDDQDAEVAVEAACALGVIADPAAVGPLETYTRSGREGARKAGTSALAGLGEPAASALTSLLNDPDEQMRAAAAGALGELRSPPAVPALLKALSDKSPDVRYAAADALGYFGAATVSAPDALLQDAASALGKLLRDPETDVCASAARALGHLGRPGTTRMLVPLLKDEGVGVRWAVIGALGRLKDEEALEPLIACLADPTLAPLAADEIKKFGAAAAPGLIKAFSRSSGMPPEGRCEAARLLAEGDTPCRQAVGVLLKGLEDPDINVRFCADKALKIITGYETSFRPDATEAERAKGIQEWRTWWRQHKDDLTTGGTRRD